MPGILELGLGEIARVPYALLRQLTPRLGRREVAARLADLCWAELAPVHILILGLPDDPADRAFVRRGVQHVLSDARRSNPIAWATAWIEADGIDAINAIEPTCLTDPRAPAELRKALRLALLNFATVQNGALRSRALDFLRAATSRHPDLAAKTAKA